MKFSYGSVVTLLAIGVHTLSLPVLAHHGSNISYDLSKPWQQKATVVAFKYINPHPVVLFDVIDAKGKVQHWHSEIVTNPSRMIRSGWGKIRVEEAMKAGTVVTLTLCPAKVGGQSALITKIVNDKCEEIITNN